MPSDACRIPASAARRFDLAPLEFSRDGGMGYQPGGDDVQDRLPQVFGALRSSCAGRRQGG